MSLVPPLENIQRGEKCRFGWLPAGDTFRSAIFLGLRPLVVFGLSPVSSRCRPCWTSVLTAGTTPVPSQFAGRVRPAGEGQGCSYRYPCLRMGKSSVNCWQSRFLAVASLAIWVILPLCLQGPWQDPDHTGFSRRMILPSFLAKEGGWLLSQLHTLKSTSHPSACNGCASTKSVTFSYPEEKMCDSRIGL